MDLTAIAAVITVVLAVGAGIFRIAKDYGRILEAIRGIQHSARKNEIEVQANRQRLHLFRNILMESYLLGEMQKDKLNKKAEEIDEHELEQKKQLAEEYSKKRNENGGNL